MRNAPCAVATAGRGSAVHVAVFTPRDRRSARRHRRSARRGAARRGSASAHRPDKRSPSAVRSKRRLRGGRNVAVVVPKCAAGVRVRRQRRRREMCACGHAARVCATRCSVQPPNVLHRPAQPSTVTFQKITYKVEQGIQRSVPNVTWNNQIGRCGKFNGAVYERLPKICILLVG